MLMLSLVGVHAAWQSTAIAPTHRARACVSSLEGRDVPQAARVLKRRAAGVHLDPSAVEAATKVLADEIRDVCSTGVAARNEAAPVAPEGFSLGAPTEAEALSTEARSAAGVAAPQPAAPGQLILVRHGQSQWNLENRFTGWANVPLSEQGRDEARQAADLLLSEDLEIDVCYTSVLERAADTAAICLDAWEAAGRKRPELLARWRLNERHYGALTGLNKREALSSPEIDAADLRYWRSSFEGKPPPMAPDHPHFSRTSARFERLRKAQPGNGLRHGRTGAGVDPNQEEPLHGMSRSPLQMSDIPLTEGLADTRERVGHLWRRELLPQIKEGKSVLVVGHANCMRALISCIQTNLSDEHLPSLGVPNALPLVYSFDAAGEPITDLPGRCYVKPLGAHYLGEGCVL
jgi:2,3-bisphosphoglycerate-dependent phosphoglycerate mutase